MSSQLIKRASGSIQKVFPNAYTDGIRDKESNKTLHEILNSYNMYFLSYSGNVAQTRCKVPKFLRREGLYITYVNYDHKVVTEWYNSEIFDDETWGADTYWRNPISSPSIDVEVSEDGYWIIDGHLTDIKALGVDGVDGVTPILSVDSSNDLLVSYDGGEQWVDLGVRFYTPDEEDITVDSENQVKFKDRLITDGKSYVILRRESSFAQQVTRANTIYEIRYDFSLGGSSFTLPQNCCLLFKGGSINNGQITCSNTNFVGVNSFSECGTATFTGTFSTGLIMNIDEAVKWYDGKEWSEIDGASSLYKLKDVLKNESGDGVYGAALNKVLTFNGTKWQADVVKVTNPLTLQVNKTEYKYDGSKELLVNIDSSFLPISGGTLTGSLKVQGDILVNDYILLHAGNYNQYSPKLDGTGATGTWNIGISGNAETATKLKTPRTIWGQPFDGSADVSGAMTGVTSIKIGDCLISYDSTNQGLRFSTGIYSEKYVSAKGSSTSGGGGGTGGGASSIYVGDVLYSPDADGIVHLPAYPTSLKSPYALTLQANGTSLGTYDGSEAKSFNFNYTNIGAAAANHTHTISQITDLNLNKYYDSTVSRAANTVLAAPDGLAGNATFRKLVSNDIPILSISKISGLQDALDSKLDVDVFNDLFEKVVLSDGVTYAIRAKYGFYSDSFVSAKGIGSSGGGGGGGEGGASTIYVGDTPYQSDSSGIVRLPAYPTTLKNPYSLTIQANDSTLGSYDGSTSKTFNIDYSNVGAAAATHYHSQYLTSHQNIYSLTIRGNGSSIGTYTPNSSSATITITPSNIGAAASSHSHSTSDITNFPSSMVNPYALTIQTNGTTLKTYDGSSAVTANITYANVGAPSTTGTGASGTWGISVSGSSLKLANSGVLTNCNSPIWPYNNDNPGINFNICDHTVSNPPSSYIDDANVIMNICSGKHTTTGQYGWQFGFFGGDIANGVDAPYVRKWNAGSIVLGWSKLIHTNNIGNYNAGSATKLQTARTIWGKSFDGTANIAGQLKDVTTITGYQEGETFQFLIHPNSEPNNYGILWDTVGGICRLYIKNYYPINFSSTNGYYFQNSSQNGINITNNSISGDYIELRNNKEPYLKLSHTHGSNSSTWYVQGYNGLLQLGSTYSKSIKVDADGRLIIPSSKSRISFESQDNQPDKYCLFFEYSRGKRLCAGSSSAMGFNAGSLLTSSSWDDYSLVPSNGIYSRGDIYSAQAITAKASSSDIRLKTDIQQYKALDIIRSHRSVKYHWNMVAKKNSSVFDDNDWHYGLIAQELQKNHPQFVKDVFGDYLTIDYERLIPIAWKGIQEVDSEVTKLKKKIKKLEMEINELKQKGDNYAE